MRGFSYLRRDEVPSIQMVDPMTMSRVSHDVVVSKWNVTPNQLGDVLALAGDSADNIPGVPGIGPKIAAALIGEYGTLDELLDRVDTVKQKGRRAKLIDNMDMARLSRQLVDLERAIPMDKMTFPGNLTSAAELRMAPLDGDRLLAFYDSMGLKDLKRRVHARLNQRKTASDGASKGGKRYYSKRPKAQVPTPDDYKDVPF
jgi:DNA polymerase-1